MCCVSYITLGQRSAWTHTGCTLAMVRFPRRCKLPFLASFRRQGLPAWVEAIGGGMKISYCTLQMVTLIFLLFVSINGGLTYSGPT